MTSTLELAVLGAALSYLLWRLVAARGERLDRRNDSRRWQRLTATGAGTSSGFSRGGSPARLPRRPPGRILRRLRAAGLAVSPAGYLAFLAALFGAVASLAWAFDATPWWIDVGLASIVTLVVDGAVGAHGRYRATRFEPRLAEAVDGIVSALIAGQNLHQAVAAAAETSREPVKEELRRLVRCWQAGMDVETSLRRIQEGYDSEGTRLFAQTLIAKMDTGGDAAPVLAKVNRIIRDRLKIRKRLQGQLAGSKVAALAVTLLPYSLIPVYAWQRPEWLEIMRTHPTANHWILAAIFFQGLGLLWVQKILRMDL